MRELLGGESDGELDGGGSGALPSGGAAGGVEAPAGVPAGDEPAVAEGDASARERRSGKESKERRREKCALCNPRKASKQSGCWQGVKRSVVCHRSLRCQAGRRDTTTPPATNSLKLGWWCLRIGITLCRWQDQCCGRNVGLRLVTISPWLSEAMQTYIPPACQVANLCSRGVQGKAQAQVEAQPAREVGAAQWLKAARLPAPAGVALQDRSCPSSIPCLCLLLAKCLPAADLPCCHANVLWHRTRSMHSHDLSPPQIATELFCQTPYPGTATVQPSLTQCRPCAGG